MNLICTGKHEKNCFLDKNGFRPSRFGPAVHHMLHVISYFVDHYEQFYDTNYLSRVEIRQAYCSIIEAYVHILYCGLCRGNLSTFYDQCPPPDPTNIHASMIKYQFQLHNHANQMTSKINFPFSNQLFHKLYIKPELAVLQTNSMFSKRFIFEVWMCLYLTALNYPSTINEHEPRHKSVQYHSTQFIYNLLQVLPSSNNNFTHFLKLAFKKTCENQTEIKFISRDQFFHFICNWESNWHDANATTTTNKSDKKMFSIFGNNCNEVHDYWENYFRVKHTFETS